MSGTPRHHNDLLVYRERMGLTQQHVAKLLGLRNTTLLSKLEQGHRLPTLHVALKLAVVYRVPVDFLYSRLYGALRDVIRRREASQAATRKIQQLPIHT